jgi:hypothetical protein
MHLSHRRKNAELKNEVYLDRKMAGARKLKLKTGFIKNFAYDKQTTQSVGAIDIMANARHKFIELVIDALQ